MKIHHIHYSLCRLLLTFANSLDPDQVRHYVGPYLDPNYLAFFDGFLIFWTHKFWEKKSADDKNEKLPKLKINYNFCCYKHDGFHSYVEQCVPRWDAEAARTLWEGVLFFLICRLGPSIYCLPKKCQEYQAPQKNIWNLTTLPPPPPPQKKSNFVPWPKKSPEMYINDPLLKIQLLGLQKYIHPKKYWKSKFWTQKNGPSLCIYENIRALPPPPPHPHWMHSISSGSPFGIFCPLSEFNISWSIFPTKLY